MRIVVLGPIPPIRGGIAAHTQGVLDALRARGHDVHAIGYSRLYPRWVAGTRPGAGMSPRSMDHDVAVDCFGPRTWRRAATNIRELEPDIVVAQYWTPVAAAAIGTVLSRVGASRRILVCHNVVPHERLPGAAILARRVMRRCDGVIFHSRFVRERAHALGCDVPSAVARVPLLVAGSENGGRPPPEIVMPWAKGARLFVCPGHLRRYKGLGVLAAAWRRAAPVADALLVVAGEWLAAWSEVQALRALGARVVFIPRYLDDDELKWLLSNAEAVLLPYVAASQSGLLPTAMRLARHVVVSDAGGLSEDLPAVDRGSSVTVVAAGDVPALAGAIDERIKKSTRTASAEADGALRHVATPISASERRNSWAPFLSALLDLAPVARLQRASNSGGSGSSECFVEFPPVSHLPLRGTMPAVRRAD